MDRELALFNEKSSVQKLITLALPRAASVNAQTYVASYKSKQDSIYGGVNSTASDRPFKSLKIKTSV
jgi:hypothetical protein